MLKTIIHSISSVWEKRPLWIIMGLALFFRVLAAVFAKGYGMHDDHFCVIDVAQQWLNGTLSVIDKGDNVRSLIYPWLHYALFFALEKCGMFDPQFKMFIVRLLHAMYSMLTVYFGYKTALLITDKKTAGRCGLLLAVFWILPFMSVRNLIEFVCIPPMMIGAYLLVLSDVRVRRILPVFAGVMMGLAFTFRFQTIVFAGVAGIVLLVKKRWLSVIGYGLGFLFFGCVVQTLSDVCLAHTYPFASFVNACYLFTIHDSSGYPVGPWYQYIGLLAGVFIPPLSLLLLYGFLKTWKTRAQLFWPTMMFLIVHSIIVNKQERFILPIVPFVLLLSVIGWTEIEGRGFWANHKKTVRGLWWWFWAVNTVLLCVVSTTYSKKSRVETLTYLSHKNDVRGIVIETQDNSPPLAPLFYLTKAVPVYYLPSSKKIETLKVEIDSIGKPAPNYAVFLSQGNIQKRVARLDSLMHGLRFEYTITPSFIDGLLYMMNPRHNVNQSSSIYKCE
jgi:hypothetical protein